MHLCPKLLSRPSMQIVTVLKMYPLESVVKVLEPFVLRHLQPYSMFAEVPKPSLRCGDTRKWLWIYQKNEKKKWGAYTQSSDKNISIASITHTWSIYHFFHQDSIRDRYFSEAKMEDQPPVTLNQLYHKHLTFSMRESQYVCVLLESQL